MVVLRSLGVGGALVLAAASLIGCGSEDKKEKMTAGEGNTPPAMSATAGGGGFSNVGDPASPVMTAGSSASSAGSSGAASAGAGAGAGADAGAGAGAGGSSSAGASGSDAGSSADGGMPTEEDPFGGLFDPGPVSCEGYLCLEAADCATLYPDENTTCKFTQCVDLMCAP